MADNKKYIQSQVFKLAGGGISLSDTSINLQSFKFPPATGSAPITMAHLGSVCTGTIEPGAAKEEIISFTGVTQNGDGSATLTGVTRGLKFGDTAGDYGQDLSLRKSHAGSTSFVITNNPQFYDGFANKNNDETILADWQVPTPANPNSIANKQYVIDALGGSVGTASNTTFGTVKTTKNQGSKPKVVSALLREQDTPDKTLKVESFRQTFIDKIVAYTGGNTPNFIDPAMGGDLSFAVTPSNGETITITVDGTACVFTAVTTIGATPGNFLIGASAATARANFAALVNNPTVTNANQVAFTGAQLTAIQKLSATDDLALNAFVRVTNPATASFSVTETMAGVGNIWTVNSTKNRYDLVVVDDAGSLQIRMGVEALSPVVPTPTNKDLPLALVFNRVGQTTIRDTDISGQGYIIDFYSMGMYRTDVALKDSGGKLLLSDFPDISSLIPPTFFGVFNQNIYFSLGSGSGVASIFSASTAGISTTEPLFATFGGSGTGTIVVRLIKSSNGSLVATHSVAVTASSPNSQGELCIIGNFVYVMTNNGGFPALTRFAKADLTGQTAMTVSGTALVLGTPLFTDNNTDIMQMSSAGSARRYTISGTTATSGSTVSYTSSATTDKYWSDGTFLYASSINSSITYKWAVAGGARTTGTALPFNVPIGGNWSGSGGGIVKEQGNTTTLLVFGGNTGVNLLITNQVIPITTF